jgi:hypothetical protein
LQFVKEAAAVLAGKEGMAAYRTLQKYMHKFYADRDHAMCNIQNRSIPAVQLTQLRKLSNENV